MEDKDLRDEIKDVIMNFSINAINININEIKDYLKYFFNEIALDLGFDSAGIYNYTNFSKMNKYFFVGNKNYIFPEEYNISKMKRFKEKLKLMEIVYLKTEDLSDEYAFEEKNFLEERNIIFFAIIPIGTKKEILGFAIFISKEKKNRSFELLVEFLYIIQKVVTKILSRKIIEKSLIEGSTRLMEFMSKIKDIYSIDLKTYENIDAKMKEYLKLSNTTLESDYSMIIKLQIKDVILNENFDIKNHFKIIKDEKLIVKANNNMLLKIIEEDLFNKGIIMLNEENKDIFENNDVKISFWVPVYFNESFALGALIIAYKEEEKIKFYSENYTLLESIARSIGKTFEFEIKKLQLLKSKEDAEKANRIKSTFLATMSHEIRTPMNSIIGFSDLLYEEETDSAKKELLKIIKYSSKNLLELINDILDISKIESKKLDINNEKVIIRKIFNEVYLIFLDIKNKKRLNFIYEISENVPDIIFTDELRVKQIIINLLSNAFKFTEKGSVKFFADYSDGTLMFEVKDTGIGISKESLDKIFNPFAQEDGSTSRKYGGTGLGLPISKSLSIMLGGDITLESNKGEGSTFKVKIKAPEEKDDDLLGEALVIRWMKDPELEELFYSFLSTLNEKTEEIKQNIKEMNKEKIIFSSHKIAGTCGNLGMKNLYVIMKSINEEAKKENPNYTLITEKMNEIERIISTIPAKYLEKRENNKIDASENFVTNGDYKILLADDSEFNQLLIKKLLAKLGLECTAVENGLEAIEELKENNYDILLLDRQMPVMNGEGVLRELNKDEKNKEIKKIVLTADAQEEVKANFFKLGCSDFISKPIEKEKFYIIIKKAIANIKKNNTTNIYGKKEKEKLKNFILDLEENSYIFDTDNLEIILKNMDKNLIYYNEIKEKLEKIIQTFDDEGLEELINNLKSIFKVV